MKNIKVKIFEKNYEILFHFKNKTIYGILEEQLSYYPHSSDAEVSHVVINIYKNLSHHKVYKKNPSTHWEIRNGFIAILPTYKVAFYFIENRLNIDLALNPSGNLLSASLKKILNMEFATREERIAQTLFEGALVPSIFFDNNKILVHSSGFVKENSTIIVGGTGGSGKTSLEIELCLNKNYSFANDDIAVINTSCELLPNLAHPKIYGYNIIGNNQLKDKLFAKLSIVDKIHWWGTYYIKGPSNVRRKLFLKDNLKYTSDKKELKKYFILSRENVNRITIEKISAKEAATLHINVISAEYNLFFNHFYWHEFNSVLDKKDPILSIGELQNNLKENSLKIFEKTKNYIVRIPMGIKHEEFVKTTVKLIEEAN